MCIGKVKWIIFNVGYWFTNTHTLSQSAKMLDGSSFCSEVCFPNKRNLKDTKRRVRNERKARKMRVAWRGKFEFTLCVSFSVQGRKGFACLDIVVVVSRLSYTLKDLKAVC